jgi:imidazoleglycerol phosphate synthase glutamine amidotransferase subunit HisH
MNSARGCISICNPVVSNIGSIKNFLLKNGINFEMVDPGDEVKTNAVLICGVSGLYFSDNSSFLKFKSWVLELNSKGVQIVGICAGMQMMFCNSVEINSDLLGIVSGVISKLSFLNPQRNTFIGTRTLGFESTQMRAYFSHGFGVEYTSELKFDECIIVNDDVVNPFVAYFSLGNLLGFQFHPERSCEVTMNFFLNKLNLSYAD